MKSRSVIYFVVAAISIVAVSCAKELNEAEGLLQGRKVSLSAKDIGVILTKGSGTDKDKTEQNKIEQVEKEQGKMFLGMMGKDSLFITLTEDAIYSSQYTKAGNQEPVSFNITTFKDDELIPYADLVISSSDGWVNYSPALYWPVNYEGISFFASTPNDGNGVFTPQYTVGNGIYKVAFDYAPYSGGESDDAEKQVDIIYAIAPAQKEEEAPVELEFIHTLSAIEFKVGNTADATIAQAKVELEGIKKSGTCTVTHPVSAANVNWNTGSSSGEYSQILQDGTSFKLIPQVLEDDAKFSITLLVGEVTHTFDDKSLKQLTSKWEPNKKYTYTITKQGEVDIQVSNSAGTTELQNTRVLNTGFTTSYIRATIVGYWSVTNSEGVEEIVSSWDITDTGTGELVKASNWGNYWKEVDGIYYYLQPVIPGAYTTPLFESYELKKTTGPVSGSTLKVNIVSQAIEATFAPAQWPELAGQNSGE